MKFFWTLILSTVLGLASFLNANNLWLLDQGDHWSLVLPKQIQGKTEIHIYEQFKKDELSPKFTFKSQGKLHGVYAEGEHLILVFPNSIFKYADKKLSLLHKAPLKSWFIGPLRSDQKTRWILKDLKTGDFYLWNMQENKREPLEELANFKESMRLPWISNTGELILMGMNESEEPMNLAFVSLKQNQVDFQFEKIENFTLGAMSQDSEGLWLLPYEGTMALNWNGSVFREEQLRPLPDPYTRWLSRMRLDGETLYLSTKGKGLDLFLGDVVQSLDLKQEGSVEVSNQDKPLLEQLALFSLLILSFILFIQWRTRFQQHMLNKEDTVLVMVSRPAPLFLRGLAFWMDIYFVSLPIIFISAHFYHVELEGLGLEDLMATNLTPSQQSDLLVERMNELLPLMGSLIICMSLYHILMEKFFGGSLGKLFFRIKVVSLDEQPLQWKQVIARATMKTLDFSLPIPPSLFFILISPLRQSLGDKVAKTQVVVQAPS